jgi:hypothetical protein
MNAHIQAPVDFSDSAAVADQALKCFKQRDFERLKTLFNEANRSILNSGQSRKFERGFLRRFETAAPLLAKVRQIEEIRVIDRDDPAGFLALAAKIRQEQHLMHIIVLTRENGGYRFDQLMTPHVLEYRKWQPLDAANLDGGRLQGNPDLRAANLPLRTLA